MIVQVCVKINVIATFVHIIYNLLLDLANLDFVGKLTSDTCMAHMNDLLCVPHNSI